MIDSDNFPHGEIVSMTLAHQAFPVTVIDRIGYIDSLTGKPWSANFHCWACVRQVQRDLFGRDLPEVPEGPATGRAATARIACGGTHVSSLGELGETSVVLELGDDAGTPTLIMRCTALPR